MATIMMGETVMLNPNSLQNIGQIRVIKSRNIIDKVKGVFVEANGPVCYEAHKTCSR